MSTAEKEREESLKCLKVYFPDHSENQLITALENSSWDSGKALEILMEETFNQRHAANQKKVAETNMLY